jgi:hypothetical protein
MLALIGYRPAEASPASPADVARSARQSVLEELQPVVLQNCELKRFGSTNDGGYLLCDNLGEGIDAAYSFGHNPPFGCDVSKRYGVPVHRYPCSEARPECEGGVVVYHDECIGVQADSVDDRSLDSLEGQIYANRDADKRLIVELDVEGEEWEPLAAMRDEVLDQIDQLAMEFHGVDEPRQGEILRRLKEHFFLVNVHFNNGQCSEAAAPLPSSVFQVLLVNKRLGIVDPDAPVPAPASPLNAPDSLERPDCQLATPRSP